MVFFNTNYVQIGEFCVTYKFIIKLDKHADYQLVYTQKLFKKQKQ